MSNIIKEDWGYRFKTVLDFINQDNGYEILNTRDYKVEDIRALVDSPKTKKWIKNGNALIMWGHRARDIEREDYLPREYHPITHQRQEPLGKITSLRLLNDRELEIRGELVETPTNNVSSAVRLLERGIAKFSLAWSPKSRVLFGMDLVYIPAFSSNRILGKVCEGEGCSLDDAIIKLAEKEKIYLDEATMIDLTNTIKDTKEYKAIKKIEMLKEHLAVALDNLSHLSTQNAALQRKLDSFEQIFSDPETNHSPIPEDSIERFGVERPNDASNMSKRWSRRGR